MCRKDLCIRHTYIHTGKSHACYRYQQNISHITAVSVSTACIAPVTVKP